MRLHRRLVDFAIAAMVAAAAAFFFGPSIEASGPPGAKEFRPELLLTAPVSVLQPDKVRLLNRLIVTDWLVGRRDSVWSLANAFGTNMDSIRSSNKLEILAINPGQVVKVPNRRGFVYTTKAGESLKSIATSFHRGKLNPTGYMHLIAVTNDLPMTFAREPYPVFPAGTSFFLPETYLNFYEFIRPMSGRIGSGFGSRFHPVLRIRRRHTGVDFPRPYGEAVHAARAGHVIFTGWRGGYGNLVIIEHPDRMTSWYGHLSEIRVESGQKVSVKTIIGNVGMTGIVTGPHLHFEVRSKTGRPLNPRNYFR